MQYNYKTNSKSNNQSTSENSSTDSISCRYGLACYREDCNFGHTQAPEASCKGCLSCVDGFSGAGVLFVSKGYIILGKEAFGDNIGLLDVLGGKCEGKQVDQTAIAEVREESAKFYNVTSEQLKNSKIVDIDSGRHLFRTWIVFDNSIKCTTFNDVMSGKIELRNQHLKKISDGSKAKYNEIAQMRKFHVNNIERRGFVSSHLKVHGTREHLPISDRARKILQTAVRLGIFGKQNSKYIDPHHN